MAAKLDKGDPDSHFDESRSKDIRWKHIVHSTDEIKVETEKTR